MEGSVRALKAAPKFWIGDEHPLNLFRNTGWFLTLFSLIVCYRCSACSNKRLWEEQLFTHLPAAAGTPRPVLVPLSWPRRRRLLTGRRQAYLHPQHSHSWSVCISLLSFAPCGLRGCKNGPAPFPGRMSYKATKPGLVCLSYLSMPYYCIVVY